MFSALAALPAYLPIKTKKDGTEVPSFLNPERDQAML
jgi:hypothetical protein